MRHYTSQILSVIQIRLFCWMVILIWTSMNPCLIHQSINLTDFCIFKFFSFNKIWKTNLYVWITFFDNRKNTNVTNNQQGNIKLFVKQSQTHIHVVKARWIYDHFTVEIIEERHPSLFHVYINCAILKQRSTCTTKHVLLGIWRDLLRWMLICNVTKLLKENNLKMQKSVKLKPKVHIYVVKARWIYDHFTVEIIEEQLSYFMYLL
jgi:hypothetical protein